MNNQSERFAIVPIEGKSPPESIVVGPMSEVMEYIGGSIARNEKEAKLAQAERDAAETERFHDEVRACAAQILADGLTRLGERIDAYETRKAERLDQQRRDMEEAVAAEAEQYLASLPDPEEPDALDTPHTMGDDGDFQAVKPPVDTGKHDPEHRNEAATGSMPRELDKGAPPQSGDYLSTTPPSSPYRSPASIGLN
jgi:hypothetical protein